MYILFIWEYKGVLTHDGDHYASRGVLRSVAFRYTRV